MNSLTLVALALWFSLGGVGFAIQQGWSGPSIAMFAYTAITLGFAFTALIYALLAFLRDALTKSGKV